MVTSRRNPVVAATSVDAHQISTQSRQAAAGSSISGCSGGNGWCSSDSELLFTSAPTAPPAKFATSSSHSQAATHQINSLQQQQQHSDSSGSSSSRFSSDSELLFTSAPTAKARA